MSWTYVISDLNRQKIAGPFSQKNCKINSKRIWIKKIIKKVVNKLYVKCEGYNNSFTSWIDKKHIDEWIFFKTEVFERKYECWVRFF